MLCQNCSQDTKEGFPYCTTCGEWIGTDPARSSAVPGSWGNSSFEQRAKTDFLSPTRAGSYREPARTSEVPAETQRQSEHASPPARELPACRASTRGPAARLGYWYRDR